MRRFRRRGAAYFARHLLHFPTALYRGQRGRKTHLRQCRCDDFHAGGFAASANLSGEAQLVRRSAASDLAGYSFSWVASAQLLFAMLSSRSMALFLAWWPLHAAQNVIQRAHCFDHVRALVQHHALGALCHGGVGDFGTRWCSLLGQCFEHLRGPDYLQHMRRFADPEDFSSLLLLRLKRSKLHSTAKRACDHDGNGVTAHRRQQYWSEVGKAALGFDLEHDAGRLAFVRGQGFLKRQYVLGAVGERSHEICVLGHECQVLFVLGCRGQRAAGCSWEC